MDVVPNEPNLVVFSKNGFIKRMKPNTFVARKRGGVGVHGTNLRQDDSMGEIVHVMLHDQLLFFTESGTVYSLRSYQIPMASRTAMGTPIAQVQHACGYQQYCLPAFEWKMSSMHLF